MTLSPSAASASRNPGPAAEAASNRAFRYAAARSLAMRPRAPGTLASCASGTGSTSVDMETLEAATFTPADVQLLYLRMGGSHADPDEQQLQVLAETFGDHFHPDRKSVV